MSEPDDLMTFEDSPPASPTKTSASPVATPLTPTIPHSAPAINWESAMNEDVFMEDAQPASVQKPPKKHRRGLSNSRWFTEDELPAVPDDSEPEPEEQPQMTVRPPGPVVAVVASGMSTGRGLGGSRWAD